MSKRGPIALAGIIVKPIPLMLVKRIVQFRVKENESSSLKRSNQGNEEVKAISIPWDAVYGENHCPYLA